MTPSSLKHILFCGAMLLCSIVHGQNEAKNWYFGTGGDGLIFNGSPPAKVNHKAAGVGFEGVVVVNDPLTGDLIFYSDGIKVINKSHAVMTNGAGLSGHSSGAQCVQACPVPGSCGKKYYLFTNSAWDATPGAISYSIVDFTSDPYGVVTNKNTPLWSGPSDQAMCLVNVANSSGYWLIVPQFETSIFKVFLITASGIVTTDFTVPGNGQCYQMNYSSGAKKFVVTGWGNRRLLVFNTSPSGLPNFPSAALLDPPFSTGPCYGARFSPDGTKLYVGVDPPGTNLVQYDFTASVWTKMNTCCFAHDLKMGPDGKMYHLHDYNSTQPIAVIDYPNLSAVGNACSYRTITFSPAFNGEVRRFPEFVVMPAPPVASRDTITIHDHIPAAVFVLTNDTSRQGDTLTLESIVRAPKSGTATISGDKILYTANTPFPPCNAKDTLIYRIKDQNCLADTAMVIFFLNSFPVPHIYTDTSACAGTSLQLLTDTFAPPATYSWSGPNGFGSSSQNPLISVVSFLNAGLYTVTISPNNGCSDVSASVSIKIYNQPSLNLGIDTTLCPGNVLTLDASSPGATYLWQDGSKGAQLQVNTAGKYKVIVTLGLCHTSDSINVFLNTAPSFSLGNDSSYCFDKPVILKVVAPSALSYLWSTGTTLDSIVVSDSGTYWIDVRTTSCTVRDSIRLDQKPVPVVNLGSDSTICKLSTLELNAQNTGATYLWENGITTQLRTVPAPGKYWVQVTNTAGCSFTDTLSLDTFTAPVLDLGNDTVLCAGSSLLLTYSSPFETYTWHNGSTMNSFMVTQAGQVSLTTTDTNHCIAKDSINVQFFEIPATGLPAQLKICDQDTLLIPEPGFQSYLWNTGSAEKELLVTAYGRYTLTVQDTNSCITSDTIDVLNDCPGKIFVPNAFTPNGDGENDMFYPVVRNMLSVHVLIYDRWGQLLFETDEPGKGWDGTYKSNPANCDVYIYVITAVDMKTKVHKERGNVTLLK